jgi:hypothetical protein
VLVGGELDETGAIMEAYTGAAEDGDFAVLVNACVNSHAVQEVPVTLMLAVFI